MSTETKNIIHNQEKITVEVDGKLVKFPPFFFAKFLLYAEGDIINYIKDSVVSVIGTHAKEINEPTEPDRLDPQQSALDICNLTETYNMLTFYSYPQIVQVYEKK